MLMSQLKCPAQFLLNSKSTYPINRNMLYLSYLYFGAGPRSEVSSGSHKCPFQSIVPSDSGPELRQKQQQNSFIPC